MIRISKEAQKRRNQALIRVFMISVPIAITTFLSWYYQRTVPWWVWAVFAGVVTASFVVWAGLDRITRWLWRWGHRKRLKTQRIAVLQEDGCPLAHTRFEPNDWVNRLEKDTALVSVNGIDDEYAAIVNPYGEVYPEESILNPRLETFEKILSTSQMVEYSFVPAAIPSSTHGI